MGMQKYSYTSASSFPQKLLVTSPLRDGKIVPVHAQVCPTNKCNLSCHFCSCKDRDKSLRLTLSGIIDLAHDLKSCGTQSVTVTGGGDPLCHPRISEIIETFHKLGIQVGLVTNGLLLSKLPYHVFNLLAWCRISWSDYRRYTSIELPLGYNVDMSFSYVVTATPDYDNLQHVIDDANKKRFTHVRVVHDLVDLDNALAMDEIRANLKRDRLVIYQSRIKSECGASQCFLSLLKPVIGADGYVYPCCGAQYAISSNDSDFPLGMRMGAMRDITDIVQQQSYFDGVDCERCYYGDYNRALGVTLDLKHVKFV